MTVRVVKFIGKGFLFIGKWFLILSAAPMFAHILFPHDADVAWRGAFDILFIGCFVAHATRGRLSRMLFGRALVVLALLPSRRHRKRADRSRYGTRLLAQGLRRPGNPSPDSHLGDGRVGRPRAHPAGAL